MIEKFEDLGFGALDEEVEGEPAPTSIEEYNNQRMAKAEAIIKEKLGLSVDELKQRLSSYVVANAEELTLTLVNIAPLGDYSKLLEDNDGMAEFLKSEAHKVEHWKLNKISPSDVNDKLLSFEFANDSIDDGESFQGFVFVSFQGKIRHAFAQGCDN
jgi:hypothetical protein